MKKSLFVAAIAAISLVACKKGDATANANDSIDATADSIQNNIDSTANAAIDSTAANAEAKKDSVAAVADSAKVGN